MLRVHKDLIRAEQIPAPLVDQVDLEGPVQGHQRLRTAPDTQRHCDPEFFLHVSKAEQKRRLLSRLQEPDKNWKFSAADLKERALWDEYTGFYEEMIQRTSTRHSPWYVVPADNKWFTHLVVAGVIIETLDSLGLLFPK